MSYAVLYRHFAGDPFFNMAVDEWLAWQASRQPRTIFLRLYTWAVGTITVGRHQDVRRALDWSRLGHTPVIRRVTGGRAVYHDPSELTYAIAVNLDHVDIPLLRGSLSRTAEGIATVLTAFLERLGRDAEYVRRSSPGESGRGVFHTLPCFASVSRHEVVSGSRKVIASAQRRFRSIFLQHGSIKLNGVATHPALALPPWRRSCVPAGAFISMSQFDSMAGIFGEVMAAFLGVTVERAEAAGLDESGMENFYRTVREHPLEARDFFERDVTIASLSGECKREKTA